MRSTRKSDVAGGGQAVVDMMEVLRCMARDAEDTKDKTPRERAEHDARLFGVGFTRTLPDGTEEYIPPEEVRIYGDLQSAKTEPSS